MFCQMPWAASMFHFAYRDPVDASYLAVRTRACVLCVFSVQVVIGLCACCVFVCFTVRASTNSVARCTLYWVVTSSTLH